MKQQKHIRTHFAARTDLITGVGSAGLDKILNAMDYVTPVERSWHRRLCDSRTQTKSL